VEVLRGMAPHGMAAAAGVSRGWWDCTRRVWRGAEEVRLRAASVRPSARSWRVLVAGQARALQWTGEENVYTNSSSSDKVTVQRWKIWWRGRRS
jgi:hypothetical protein